MIRSDQIDLKDNQDKSEPNLNLIDNYEPIDQEKDDEVIINELPNHQESGV